MKTLACVLVFIVATTVMATEKLQIDAEGNVYVTQEVPKRDLTLLECEAYNNPGELIHSYKPIVEEIGFFHYVTVSHSTNAACYMNGKIEYINENLFGKRSSKKTFVYRGILLIGALWMFAGNIFYSLSKRIKKFSAINVSTVLTYLVAGCSVSAIFTTIFLDGFVVAMIGSWGCMLTSLVAGLSLHTSDISDGSYTKLLYLIASFVFYVFYAVTFL